MTTLTPDQLLKLINTNTGRRGAAMFHLQQDRQRANGALSPAQRAFVQQLADAPRAERPTIPGHPGQSARLTRRPADGDDLTPAELIWLQRLPSDPSAVSFEDATTLASMANSISAEKAPSSARLVRSIWEPVKQLHDRNVARAQLEAARAPIQPLPSELGAAMREAVRAQYQGQGLSDQAIEAQFSDVIARLHSDREQSHAAALNSAQRAYDEAHESVLAQGVTGHEVGV